MNYILKEKYRALLSSLISEYENTLQKNESGLRDLGETLDSDFKLLYIDAINNCNNILQNLRSINSPGHTISQRAFMNFVVFAETQEETAGLEVLDGQDDTSDEVCYPLTQIARNGFEKTSAPRKRSPLTYGFRSPADGQRTPSPSPVSALPGGLELMDDIDPSIIFAAPSSSSSKPPSR